VQKISGSESVSNRDDTKGNHDSDPAAADLHSRGLRLAALELQNSENLFVAGCEVW